MLAQGLQNALWILGGAPREHRSGTLSVPGDTMRCASITAWIPPAATVVSHTRTARAHGHVKKAAKDALLIRGTQDFDSLASYRCFIDEIVSRKNARHTERINAERPMFQPPGNGPSILRR